MYTVTVRDRWQVTLPDSLRKMLDWLEVGSVIEVEPREGELIMRPYDSKVKKTDWKSLQERLKWISSFKGKRGNLSQLIVEDRESH